MSVLVEEVMMAKTNKSLRVKLGGKWYGAYLDSGLNAPALINNQIEAEIVTLEKGGPWIKGWKPVSVGAPAAPMPSPAGHGPAAPITREREPEYAKPAPVGTVAPYWLPMASNVVAHAIQAGIITSPNQIKPWVDAARVAAVTSTDDSTIPF